jgi:hypothetical protein
MSTASCLFVATFAPPRERLAALERLYAPLGLETCTVEERGGAWLGRLAGPGGPLPDLLAWGAPLGAAGHTAGELLTASDARLREIVVGMGALVAASPDRLRLVTAPSGPLALHVADGPGGTVWSTHAVAAAWLARGDAELDPAAVPEYLAFDFVGGGRTLVRGVAPVAPATVVDVGGGARSFWPPAERWAPVPEPEAQAHAERALLVALQRRLGARTDLALTAGADSRVLAVALAELGADWRAFTWGDDGWPDVDGARAVAAALGAPFSRSLEWLDDDVLRARFAADAVWADGLAALSFAARTWPADAAAVLGGMGGEVGRAFYYAPAAAPGAAAGDLAGHLHAEAWVESAAASGQDGWRRLDVVYAEQRVARWGRTQVPPLAADFVPGFCAVDVARGLVSLPLADRTGDAFHRRFVAARRPDLALPAPAPPAPAGRARRLARRVRRRVRPPTAPADAFVVEALGRRPVTRAWLVEEVLEAPVILDAMGRPWAERTREGLLRGEPRPSAQALLAAGPVALAGALSALR